METSNPRISVIVPVYKVEAYLEKCVNSLINQTYENLDIILVDDGSPDNCPAICDHFADQHTNIIALHKKNGGLSDARNYGVKYTENEWIVFVDSDDYVEPVYVETLVNLKNQFDAQMVVTRVVRENEDGGGKPKHRQFESYLVENKTALYQMYSGKNIGWGAIGKLLPRKILLKYPFPDGYYEDCACMYKIIDEFDRIAIGDFESNYHYVQRTGSILRSSLNEKHYHIFDIVKEFEAYIKEKYPDMDILIVLLYKRGVVQILNLQSMSWNTYKNIFMSYRKYFRDNFRRIVVNTEIPIREKIYYMFLCGRPKLFYIQKKILSMIRS